MTAGAEGWALAALVPQWAAYWPHADPVAMAEDVRDRAAAGVAAWGVDGATPLPGGRVALVLAGTRAGRLVVLKTHPRGHGEEAELRNEAEALAHWRPTRTAVELLDGRDGGLTLLLERLVPGTPLYDVLPYDEALVELGRLARELHSAGAPPGGTVGATVVAGLRRGLTGDPAALAELDALTASAPQDVLLHDDLHGHNALRTGHGWTVIDPHAVLGDPAADGWCLLDPLAPALPPDAAAARSTVAGRVRAYAAAADLDPDRVTAWARLRALAEARAIDGAEQAAAQDRHWAVRLHRFADAAGAGLR